MECPKCGLEKWRNLDPSVKRPAPICRRCGYVSILPHIRALKALRANCDLVEWAKDYPTLQAAWGDCDRAAWMLWLIGRTTGKPMGDGRKPLVLCCCEIARQALYLEPDADNRPRMAIELAERWAEGADVTREELQDVVYIDTFLYSPTTAIAPAYAAYAVYAGCAAAHSYSHTADSTSTFGSIVRKHFPKAPELVMEEA